MEEGQKHPPRKVVYCRSYGRYGISGEFRTFYHSHSNEAYRKLVHGFDRSDPALIEAISDYGRFICDRFLFILDDMRTVYTWKLDRLLFNLSSKQHRRSQGWNSVQTWSPKQHHSSIRCLMLKVSGETTASEAPQTVDGLLGINNRRSAWGPSPKCIQTFRWRSIALDPAVLASRLALRFAHVL